MASSPRWDFIREKEQIKARLTTAQLLKNLKKTINQHIAHKTNKILINEEMEQRKIVTAIVALLDRLPQKLVAGEVAVAEVELHLNQKFSEESLEEKYQKRDKKKRSGCHKAASRTWRRTLFALASSSGAAAGAAMGGWFPVAIELETGVRERNPRLGFRWFLGAAPVGRRRGAAAAAVRSLLTPPQML